MQLLPGCWSRFVAATARGLCLYAFAVSSHWRVEAHLQPLQSLPVGSAAGHMGFQHGATLGTLWFWMGCKFGINLGMFADHWCILPCSMYMMQSDQEDVARPLKKHKRRTMKQGGASRLVSIRQQNWDPFFIRAYESHANFTVRQCSALPGRAKAVAESTQGAPRGCWSQCHYVAWCWKAPLSEKNVGGSGWWVSELVGKVLQRLRCRS